MLNSNYYTDGIDYNGDGDLDETWTFRNDKLSKTEIDRNFDGNTDATYYYDQKQWVDYTKLDSNFDGVFEIKSFYKYGNVYKTEIDSNQNKIIDMIFHYKSGELDTAEIIDEKSNRKKINKDNMMKLVSTKFD